MTWVANNQKNNVLRIFLGLIFLSAGIFRIFNPELAKLEMIELHLPDFFTWLIIILEIVGGILLLFNKYVKKVLIFFTIFLITALIIGLIINGREIIYQAKELFVYNLNPTDFFLHFTFLIIIIVLLSSYRKK